MATTKVNNSEYQKSMAQYQAVAEYANEVFQTMTISSDEGAVRMTAAQVAKAIYNTIRFTADNGEENQQHTFEAPGMTLTTTPRMVFGQLAQLESMLKIKKADRMTFAHTYELLKLEQVEASCFIPVDIATICEYAAKDELRPVMGGVCFDFENSAIVASNGHVLLAVPMNAGTGAGRWIVPKKFLESHAGCIIQFTNIDGKQYAYVCQERTRLIEGRYPDWKSVIPVCDTKPIHVGNAWKELVDRCSMLGNVNETTNMVKIAGKMGEHKLTLSASDIELGTSQNAEVCIDGEIPFDFIVGAKGTFFKKYPPFTDIYLHDWSRAMLMTDGVCVLLQMPMLIEGEEIGWEATPIKKAFVPEVLKAAEQKQEDTKPAEPAPEPEKPKASKPKKVKEPKKVEEKVVVCSVPKESKADVTPTPAEESKPGSYSVVINDVVVAEVTHSDVNDTAPAEVSATPQEAPKTVCDTAMAHIHGTWVPVEEMTRTNGRIMVRRIDNKQRAIVALVDFRTKGSSMPTDEVTEPAPAPVCDTPAEPTKETTKPESEATDDNAVYIADYSEKAIFVWGATKSKRRELKKYGSWNGKRSGWILSKKRREYVEKLFGNKLQAAPMPAAPAQEETVNAAA